MAVLALLWGRQVDAQVNVTTYHYDTAGTGQNLQETKLSPTNVNPTAFGKLFSYRVDGFVYAQPLYLTNVSIPSQGFHNVVFAATEHDSVYAFDADNPKSGPAGDGLLWKRVFINPSAGITTVPTIEVYPNPNFPDIRPEIGITSTPVIDYDARTGVGTLYVVVKTKEVRGADIHYVQKLHALDVGTGLDRVGSPRLIADTIFNGIGNPYIHDPANPCVPGTGDGSQSGQVCFNSLRQLNRQGLGLMNGVVYVGFASHGDNGPYHGWVLGYRTTDLGRVATYNNNPNGGLAGFWEGGAAPVFDADGRMYEVAGNGTFRFDADGTVNYGESVVKLSTTPEADGRLPVLDFFTPFEFAALNTSDLDQGSGGIMLLPDQAGPHPHLMVQTGKRGKIYLLDRDSPGQYRHGEGCDQEPVLETCDGTVQFTANGTVAGGSYGAPAYFNDGSNQFIYYGGNGDAIKAFQLDPDTGTIRLPPVSQTSETFGFTGVTPTVSASGTENALLWGLNVNGFGLPARPTPSPMILFAYDASDLSTPLYSSAITGVRDRMGDGVKFNTPTVANGHVYVGTQTALDVFGLFDVAVDPPIAPTNLVATSGPPAPALPSITLTWTNNATNATGVRIERSLNGIDFMLLSVAGRAENTFVDTTTLASTTYLYRVIAVNQVGQSAPSNISGARTHIGAPVVQVIDVFAIKVKLGWTATANDHYEIERSIDGTSFDSVGNVPPSATPTFTDDVSAFGRYLYRVKAFNTDGDQATSNVISGSVGPVNVDHPSDFADHSDLTGNANTSRPIFTGPPRNVIQLTDGMNSEAGTVFTDTQVGIRRFTTSFTFQARPGTVLMADGLTFIIQGKSPMALGASGGGMGYQGIQDSVAIKFDLFNHGHGGYSTGQYLDGHNPDVPGPGEADISLVDSGINLQCTGPSDCHAFRVDLDYDGTRLIETITDTTTGSSVRIGDYPPVNIPAHVNSDTAFVGFGAGTGGLNAIQEIQSWTFNSDEADLPPRRPSSLAVTNVQEVGGRFDVTLAWKGNNAYTATGYEVQRSTDGTTFSPIATLPIDQTGYTDRMLAPGGYFYRVRSFDETGSTSAFTATLCVPLAAGGGLDHSSGFACHGDLVQNGNAALAPPSAPTFARLTDGGASEAGSIFTLGRLDITRFSTSFTLRIHDPANADGMCFAIQGNDPNQLGFTGGGLGYASDTRGGPRGIRNSLCVKFDIFDNQGEGPNSTGLFGDGRSPTVPERDSGDVLVDLRPTPIDLHSQHAFQVDLSYDGVTLTETIKDTVTMNTFTTTYGSPGNPLNIPAMVGGTTAFVGFTGGTGGLTATQDVQTWKFSSR